MFELKIASFKVFIIVLLFNNNLCFGSRIDVKNPIYANHYFARQFFRYFYESNISLECRTVANYVKNHTNEDWALRLIDSSGVVGSGLAKGNYQFMGDFDECLDISVTFESNQKINGIKGQYCTLGLPMQMLVGNQTKDNPALDITALNLSPSIGICLPNACNREDLVQILNTFSSKTGHNITIEYCIDSADNQIKLAHIIVISGFGIIILLILIGTFIEATHMCTKKEISSKLYKTIEAFSLNKNTLELFSTGNEKETIGCFHGFRLISLFFIIIYHIYTEAQLPSRNLLEILESQQNFILQIVTNAGLWVEAFFLLSGFLYAYRVIVDLRSKSIKHYKPLTNIIHRYLRLTPSLLGIIAFSILQELIGSGPQWHTYVEISEQSCHKNWWTNILYINNIIGLNQLGKDQTECLAFTWYLAVDMQLFLISPILVLFLASNDLKKQYFGIGINIVVIIASFIITAVITVNSGLTPTVLMNVYDLDYINKIYKQAYCRVGPYAIGILMAYFYQKYKGIVVIRPKLNLFLWLLSIMLNLGITFLTWPWLLGQSYHNFASVLYGSTHRTLWAMSWAYILFACATGHGSIVNTILSWKALVPLSRLSFQAYLYHSVLISRFVSEARQPIYSSKLNLIMMFFQYTVLTFVVSYVAFLMFEMPFSTIERLYSHKKTAKTNREVTTKTNNQQI